METNKKLTYKWCIVPGCVNTTAVAPEKLFFSVPYDQKRRKSWIKAVRRDFSDLAQTSHLYVCEDHFKIQEDMDNYVKFKLMGGQMRIKSNVVPHIFACQGDRKRAAPITPRKSAAKRLHKSMIEDILATSTSSTDTTEMVQCLEDKVLSSTSGASSIYAFKNDLNATEHQVTANIDYNHELKSEFPDTKYGIKLETVLNEELIIKNEDDTTAADTDIPQHQDSTSAASYDNQSINQNYLQCVQTRKAEKKSMMKSNLKYKRQFECTLCGYRCSYEGVLKTHLLTHTGQRFFECTICKYKCLHSSALKSHVLVHTGEKPFKCTVCEYKCAKKGNLKVHLLTHRNDKLFQCSKCEYKCPHKSRLKLHMLTHTGERPFKCNLCEYKCSTKGNLKVHLLTHTGERPFKCTFCEYRCALKCRLKSHILTHTGERPFECNVCGYKCAQKGNLKQHLLTHTGDKPLKCTVCDYKFLCKLTLKAHILTHTSEKPSKGIDCLHKCSDKTEFKAHFQTHTDEQRFECTVCDCKHSEKSAVKQHSLINTEKSFKCKVCNYLCKNKNKLYAHILTHTTTKPINYIVLKEHSYSYPYINPPIL